MARRTRSSKLENRTARLKLEIRTKPHFVMIAPKVHLGYRRNQDGPGSWSVKAHGWLRKFAVADDREDSNGDTIMDYWQALAKAQELARVGEGDSSDAPITIRQAIEDYEATLKMTGGRKYNATTLLRCHLPETFGSKTLALTKKRDFSDWLAGLIKKGLKPDSAKRYAKSLASALNLAAANHDGIKNAKAWKEGLTLASNDNDDDDDEIVRDNFILSDQAIAAIVRGCYEEGQAFGLIVNTLSETGARESQVLRLKVRSLNDDDPAAPFFSMPTSRKGSNRKKARKTEYRPLPILPRLAVALRQHTKSRAAHEPLFDRIPKLAARFKLVVQRLGLDPALSPYCMRHTSIVRQLLQGLPIRLVAANHDTSTAIIEKHYSRFIVSRHTDAMTRATLLDLSLSPPADNVTPIAPIRAA